MVMGSNRWSSTTASRAFVNRSTRVASHTDLEPAMNGHARITMGRRAATVDIVTERPRSRAAL